MSNELSTIMRNTNIPLPDLFRMAEVVAKSGLFGVKNVDHAMALMLVAQAEGLHPMAAVQQFHIINGTPARKSWSMLERFQKAGGSVEWKERSDTRVVAIFSHPQGGAAEIDWDLARAKKAQITNPMWSKYPRQMMTARVISEGVRTVFPGSTGGFYTPEEEQDMQDVTPPKKEVKHPNAKGAPQVVKDAIRQQAKDAGFDPDTGEIHENGADPFAGLPSDNIGPEPELPREAPQQVDETERAYQWGNRALAAIEKITTIGGLDHWAEKNKTALARANAANPEAGFTVATAIETRHREIEAGL